MACSSAAATGRMTPSSSRSKSRTVPTRVSCDKMTPPNPLSVVGPAAACPICLAGNGSARKIRGTPTFKHAHSRPTKETRPTTVQKEP